MLRFKLHHLFAFSLLLTSLCQLPAKAMGVNFDVDSPRQTVMPTVRPNANFLKADSPVSQSGNSVLQHSEPLPIPSVASQPPIRVTEPPNSLPSNLIASTRHLTPPPAESLPKSRVISPMQPAHQPIGISFHPVKSLRASASNQPSVSTSPQLDLPQWIYNGGANSLVARVIGSAEGTRTPSGQPTHAYYGHKDPGNGVWNLGTFSYQHGANSPQEADTKQLKRLQKQGKTIVKQADKAELSMSLGEILNGLDLANQSPRAALERGGYIDRLAQARKKGMPDHEAIVWARTYAYLDPDTQRWNAPGLGNTLSSIQRDQNRRHEAINQAFNSYRTQQDNQGTSSVESLTVPIIAFAPPELSQAAEQVSQDSINTQEPVLSYAEPARVTTNQNNLVKKRLDQPITNATTEDTAALTQAESLAFSMAEEQFTLEKEAELDVDVTPETEQSQTAKSTANIQDNSQASAIHSIAIQS